MLVALEAAERVQRDLEVVGFADEEGVRFGTAYLGSAAMAGRFDPVWLELRDRDGVRLGDLVGGGRRRASDLLGYVEVHIEQGPVLERLDEPLGVVTAIAGQSHAALTFVGEAGHAGTVPDGRPPRRARRGRRVGARGGARRPGGDRRARSTSSPARAT